MYSGEMKKIIIVVVGALLNAIAMNFFLIPANVYASGFTGVAQLLSRMIGSFAPFNVSTGILLLLLNIPVTIIAWRKVGKSFTFYSFLSVVLMSFFMEIIPITRWSPDILLNAVFGGVIAAVGVGITLKYGASTGGMDIIAMLLSRKKDKPVGYLFISAEWRDHCNGRCCLWTGKSFVYTCYPLHIDPCRGRDTYTS